LLIIALLMKSLFDPSTHQEILNRINSINGSEQAKWGKLTINSMLEHCTFPLLVAAGQATVKVNPIVKFFLKGIIKKSIIGTEPFRQNLPTMAEYKVTNTAIQDVTAAKQNIFQAIATFIASEPTANNRVHPVCGPLTKDEWGWSQYKHLDHHLGQFGV
jgi:hypothetical protein